MNRRLHRLKSGCGRKAGAWSMAVALIAAPVLAVRHGASGAAGAAGRELAAAQVRMRLFPGSYIGRSEATAG
jgi:hypothetical protein